MSMDFDGNANVICVPMGFISVHVIAIKYNVAHVSFRLYTRLSIPESVICYGI